MAVLGNHRGSCAAHGAAAEPRSICCPAWSLVGLAGLHDDARAVLQGDPCARLGPGHQVIEGRARRSEIAKRVILEDTAGRVADDDAVVDVQLAHIMRPLFGFGGESDGTKAPPRHYSIALVVHPMLPTKTP